MGSAAGDFFAEIPEPVDYRTDSMKLEGGYIRNPFFFSFSYAYSSFRNQNPDVSITNELGLPPTSGGRFFSLPADSKMHKLIFRREHKASNEQ